jgi:hypothetical protein
MPRSRSERSRVLALSETVGGILVTPVQPRSLSTTRSAVPVLGGAALPGTGGAAGLDRFRSGRHLDDQRHCARREQDWQRSPLRSGLGNTWFPLSDRHGRTPQSAANSRATSPSTRYTANASTARSAVLFSYL